MFRFFHYMTLCLVQNVTVVSASSTATTPVHASITAHLGQYSSLLTGLPPSPVCSARRARESSKGKLKKRVFCAQNLRWLPTSLR